MAELLAAGEAFRDALAWICLRGAVVLFAALALWRVGRVVLPPVSKLWRGLTHWGRVAFCTLLLVGVIYGGGKAGGDRGPGDSPPSGAGIAEHCGGGAPQLRDGAASVRLPAACDVGEAEGFGGMPGATNLMLTAILREGTSTCAVVSWPFGQRPADDLVDIYAGTNLLSLAKLFSVDVADCLTNALVVVADEGLAGTNACPSAFISAGDATDTDGDGLSDAEERFFYHTNPNARDTDGDGLDDGEEVAFGTCPTAADTDGDGIDDGEESGYVYTTMGPVWQNVGSFVDVTDLLSTSAWHMACVDLPSPLLLQGVAVSNVSVSACGAVFFNRSGRTASPRDVHALDFSHPVEADSLVVAPFSDADLCLRTNATHSSSVKVGTVSLGGRLAVCIQYKDMGRDGAGSETNNVSFQVLVPVLGGDSDVFVVYRDVVGVAMDGRHAGVGFQTFGGRGLRSVSYLEPGSVFNHRVHLLHFGADTDPTRADTDGDGLTDGEELGYGGLTGLGTDPHLWDTDGDCLPDGWENANGLDPLSNVGDDGAAGDPDNDTLSNFSEYAVGADPQNANTFSLDVDDSVYVGYGMCAFPPLSGVEVSVSVGDPSGSHSERWKLTLEEEGGFGRRYQVVCGSYGTVNTRPVVLEPGRHYIGRIEHLGTDGMLADYDWMAQIDGLPTTPVMSTARERWTCIADKLVMIDNESGLLGTCDEGFGTVNYAEGKHFDVYTVSVRPTNIKFNWNPNSAANDAINLRRDYATPYDVSGGEYTLSHNFPVCYVTNVTPVVKAKFSVVPDAVSSLELDAVLNGTLISDLGSAAVSFTSGESGYADFAMSGAVASSVGLNASNSYTWRVRAINRVTLASPKSVASTGPHKTYVILGEPVGPWSNTPNEHNNAWSTALDLTCQWASGKTTRQQVATAVTKEINECDRFVYDMLIGGERYSCNSGLDVEAHVDLTSFIDRINGKEGNGMFVNCQDCASAVVAMSNLVGCDLWCNRLERNFNTRKFLPIGFPELIERNFVFHEVAWEGQCRDQDLVYDACLQYDVDETPGVEPFVLDSPCGVMFSDGSELSPFVYRERLSANGANGYERCVNQNTRLRRSLR